MSKNKKDIPYWAQLGHSKPVTRRDFLATGMIPFAASMMVPNWLSLILGNQASAQSLNCPVPSSFIPFITINLAGGAAMASNYLPMNAAREPIASYNRLGLGDNQVPIEREFGNAPFAGMQDGQLLSRMLAGIRDKAAAATLANTAFVAIPCDSQNDSNLNKFDLTGAVARAGLAGSLLPNLGRRNSKTGINQSAALMAPPTPLIVSDFNAILNSVGYSASLGTSLNASQKNSLTKLVKNLNSSQNRKLASVTGAEEIRKVLDCAGIKNTEVVAKGASLIDPRPQADYSQIWNIAANTAANNVDLIFGSMVYNSLMGYSGSANLELGGYDYHDGSRTTGNTRDFNAGVLMGRVLQSAALLQKPVFLYVISDGSVFSPTSESRSAVWQGDRGANGVAYMFYYNPKGRPATSDFQIGQFNDTQSADRTFITGGSPEATAAAVFANWCAANKRNDLYAPIAGTRIIDSANISKVIKFV